MRKILLIITVIMAGWAQALAVRLDVSVADVVMERNGSNIEVDFGIDLSRLDLKSTRALLITPRLVKGGNVTELPSVGVYGRRRYYHYVRNGESMLTGPGETTLQAADCPDRLAYQTAVPYSEWMRGATLELTCYEYGCCSTIVDEWAQSIGGYREFIPQMIYDCPAARGVKTDSITGTAYVIFEVDKTVLKQGIMNNAKEIGKINADIDTVRNDKDITILSVTLKGFASPESPYRHNADLAKGRVEAVRDYLQQRYHFEPGVISTEYEPENWEGLREYVSQSNLTNRDAILRMIDSDMEPDAKEAAIRKAYPDDYRHLHEFCYPMLRRTDYSIKYVVSNFTDIYDIKRIIKTQPQKLSLEEMFLLANTYEPGSEDYCEVFDVAVRMFPNDRTANLNAANAAMSRGDFNAAARFLEKAGSSPQAVYAKGVHAYMTGDYNKAVTLLAEAEKNGVEQAAEVKAEAAKRLKTNNK